MTQPAGLFVDTSVWSLAFRRDRPPDIAEIEVLHAALTTGVLVVSTGLVVQELLQGFRGPRQRENLLRLFGSLRMVWPSRADHVEAADIKNSCRQRGVQLGTVDALLAALCVRRRLSLLTTDHDFANAAVVVDDLTLWHPEPGGNGAS